MTRTELIEATQRYIDEMAPLILETGCIVPTILIRESEKADLHALEAHAHVAAIYNTTYASVVAVKALLPAWKWANYAMLGDDASEFQEVILLRKAIFKFKASVRKNCTHLRKRRDKQQEQPNEQ